MDTRQPIKEWSVPIRINHWGMVISIFILIATGFYIAGPFTVSEGETVGKFFMGNVRFVHILFGVFLTFIFIWRVYLAFFSKFHADWKDFFAFTDWPNTVKQLKFYALVSKEPAEHKYLYGPMQSLAYGGLMFMLLLIVLTGVILMGAGYHAGLTGLVYKIVKPFEYMMGGLATVRWFHHILTWGFILFIVVHIYMAFWYDVIFKQGTVSSMISGIVFKKDHS
jgi:Ni/Fe-hydrogenase 1 B-type cytochrome subunit